MWWCADDLESDLSLIGDEYNSNSNISPDEMSNPPNQDSQIEPPSSQAQVKQLLDPLPILMRRHTLFNGEDSDGDDDYIRTEDTCDIGLDTSLFSVESPSSPQTTDHFEELANLPHEIVERSRQLPPWSSQALSG